ncbi:MAG: hypothetical protein PHV16_01960 [Candidatus Nanoarchaeia archaeon]|nr:hypothetical protein [Candidatus Nanoarchaeia archaeon]
MALFGSKKGDENISQGYTNVDPVDLVLQMREQGLSNNQIISSLQREGYQTTQIFDAMNQADLSRANGAPVQESQDYSQEQISPQELLYPNEQQFQQEEVYEQPDYSQDDATKIEELVEAVVEEKWVDIVRDIKKVVEWKSRVDSDIASIRQEINDLKESFNSLHKNIIGKIDEYDRNISNASTNIKAMENVFQKAIPRFTENINELSRTVEDLRNMQNKKKK